VFANANFTGKVPVMAYSLLVVGPRQVEAMRSMLYWYELQSPTYKMPDQNGIYLSKWLKISRWVSGMRGSGVRVISGVD